MSDNNVRGDLLSALAKIELAKSTNGLPGGKANLASAEMEAGRFLAQHGRAVLGLMLEQGGGRVRAAA